MKEAIVTKVVQKKDNTGGYHNWNAQPGGLMWTWQVAFNNKDWGEFNVKDGYEPKFKVGLASAYTIEVNQHDPSYPAKVTWCNPDYPTQATATQPSNELPAVRESFKEDPDRQRLIIRQTCIKAAAEYTAQSSAIGWENVADDMLHWVLKPETVEAKEIANDALTQEFKQAAEEDDLPF